LWGKGKTSFHEKRSFSLPPHPHPFSRKAEYFGSRWSHTLYSNKLSHPYSRSERFTFADRQTLHIAKQFFTTDEIRHFTSPPPPFSREKRSILAPVGRILYIQINYHIFTREASASRLPTGEHFTLQSNSSRRMKSVTSHPQIIYHILTREASASRLPTGEHFTLQSNSSRRMKSVTSHPHISPGYGGWSQSSNFYNFFYLFLTNAFLCASMGWRIW